MTAPDMIIVDVTQEDIDKGLRGHCESCPISLAVQRVVDARVITWGDTVEVKPIGEVVSTYHHDASGFVRSFDIAIPVDPRVVCLTRV